MGRTILSATQTWVEEDKALTRYIRALRKSDQNVLQELLALSRSHIAEASYASNLYPMDIYLMSMLLEMYKKVKHLETRLEALGVDPAVVEETSDGIPELPSLVNLVSPEEPASKEPEQMPKSGVVYVDFEGGV
ncbi:MAG TPA: hypothetical protein PK040_08710 [Anaerolineaceae bacterium]|nr:hypothetical protein [Anaerolineaceae bacterium]